MKLHKKEVESKYSVLWRVLFGILIAIFALISLTRLNYIATIFYLLISAFIFIPGRVFKIEKDRIKIIIVIVAIMGIGLLNHFTFNQDKNELPSELELPSNIDSINFMAENILQSINDNNYTRFKENFSNNLTILISEQKFTEVRDLILETSGKYILKSNPKLYEVENYYLVYEYSCLFEKENVTFDMSLGSNSKDIEGILFSSENLIKASQ